MASYTIELQFLLRGFSEANEKPDLFVSPRSMIEMSRKNFFKAIGSYPFKIWGDERDKAFQDEFEINFLESFYTKEINYYSPDAFYLHLGSFLRRKMPIHCQHMRAILEEMYVTQTGKVLGNSKGSSKNDDTRKTDSHGKSNTHNETNTENQSNTVNRGAKTDTPQGYLDMNLDELDYATEVSKSDSNVKGTGKSISQTDTESEDHTVSVGNAQGATENSNTTDNYGRSKDVFEIYDEWLKSGYDLFTPLYDEMMQEQIFMIFN